MTTLFPMDEKCPLCSKSFPWIRVGSFTIIGRFSDFRPIYAGISPLPFMVKSCPTCHVAYFFDGDYIRKLDETKKNSLKESFHDLIRKVKVSLDVSDDPTNPVIFRTILACEIAEMLKVHPKLLASFWHNAAWILQNENETGVLHQNCIKNARDAYLKCIESPSLELSYGEREIFIYLVGELSRRLGEFKLAVDFLERVSIQDLVERVMELRDLALEGDAGEK